MLQITNINHTQLENKTQPFPILRHKISCDKHIFITQTDNSAHNKSEIYFMIQKIPHYVA